MADIKNKYLEIRNAIRGGKVPGKDRLLRFIALMQDNGHVDVVDEQPVLAGFQCSGKAADLWYYLNNERKKLSIDLGRRAINNMAEPGANGERLNPEKPGPLMNKNKRSKERARRTDESVYESVVEEMFQ